MGGTLPRCARCLREVEHLERSTDHRSGDETYTAVCHGERESVTVTRAELLGFGARLTGMAFTVAFSKSRAAEQQPPFTVRIQDSWGRDFTTQARWVKRAAERPRPKSLRLPGEPCAECGEVDCIDPTSMGCYERCVEKGICA